MYFVCERVVHDQCRCVCKTRCGAILLSILSDGDLVLVLACLCCLICDWMDVDANERGLTAQDGKRNAGQTAEVCTRMK